MKTVFVVTKICDYEYGCREIESIWSSNEAAEDHIEKLGGRNPTMMWSGRMVDQYDIEIWEIKD